MAKKFEFRLERVMKYRSQQQKLAEQRQREAYNSLLSAQQLQAEIQAEFDDAANSNGLVGRGMHPLALANAVDHLAEIESRLARVRQKVAAAQSAFDKAEQERTEATKETEILKTLRQDKLIEHKRETELEAQDAIDENVMRKWSRSESPTAELEPELLPGESQS